MDSLNIQAALFSLLRSGLWGRTDFDPSVSSLTDDAWKRVFTEAMRQTVTGLVFEGICRLPDDCMPREELLAKWTAAIERIERNNKRMNDTLVTVCRALNKENLSPVLLKGQGIARLYNTPLLRECGDIDLHFPDVTEWEKAAYIIGKGFRIEKAHDGSAVCNCNGVIIEIHKTMFDMQSSLHGKILRLMEQREGFQLTPLFDKQGIKILTPSSVSNLILLSLHILRHALCFGIGLRQLCDYAVTYNYVANHDSAALNRVNDMMKSLGLRKWHLMLESFIDNYLDVRIDTVANINCNPLMAVISHGGNFGFHAQDNNRSFRTVVYNNCKLFHVAPMQALITLSYLFARRLKR